MNASVGEECNVRWCVDAVPAQVLYPGMLGGKRGMCVIIDNFVLSSLQYSINLHTRRPPPQEGKDGEEVKDIHFKKLQGMTLLLNYSVGFVTSNLPAFFF